ncbi:hypothetical protein DSCO28_55150 [Desulfosarcina ovata subsp. sediminis]|uniref:Uncharacterized protein n=1 Tax=Desulfosarcina ovata subsp. sediminis TaxID=885957 RepID=A0A5K7ZXH5_9BACT|nr:hypothetical protein [Desulfosarcina ovata]BBO84949.1 hypothetical protein DSCO28_55150 [Desulfosarcina ovata subsp. sediminis]
MTLLKKEWTLEKIDEKLKIANQMVNEGKSLDAQSIRVGVPPETIVKWRVKYDISFNSIGFMAGTGAIIFLPLLPALLFPLDLTSAPMGGLIGSLQILVRIIARGIRSIFGIGPEGSMVAFFVTWVFGSSCMFLLFAINYFPKFWNRRLKKREDIRQKSNS